MKQRTNSDLLFILLVLALTFPVSNAFGNSDYKRVVRKPLLINRPDLPRRVINFPDDGFAIGRMFLFRLFRVDNMLFLGNAIQDLGYAKGSMVLPPGKCAGLVLTPEGLGRIEELKCIAPDDIQILHVACMPFESKDLSKLVHLKGLEKLDMSLVHLDDSAPQIMAKFPKLWSIAVTNSQMTGKNLNELNKLKNLKVLNLSHNRVGDRALVPLAKNRSIYCLTINSCKITSKAADYLVKMQQLQHLRINTPGFSDEAILKIRSLKNLSLLEVGQKQVSEKALKSFKEARPKCKVIKTYVDPL